MQWFPVGPDFVFDPVDSGFTRLSPSNEGGLNGRVLSIAIEASADPLHPAVVYVVGGEGTSTQVRSTSVFRKAAADASWSCPGDALLSAFPLADPACVAVHPSFPDHAYVGTWGDRAVYPYDGSTDTWGARSSVPGRVRRIVVDPRPVAAMNQTILYAATDNGVFRSANNGGAWTQVLAGDCWSLAAHIPAGGSPRFYAGLAPTGVWFADTEPLGQAAWTNLNIAPAGFSTVLVDFCVNNPDCAYAWFANDAGGDAVYSTLHPRGAWTEMNGNVSAPDLNTGTPFLLQQWQTFDNLNFAVSPDSPGDGHHDVLFFGSLFYARSIDSGTSWTIFRDYFHVDVHAFAFASGPPAAFYLGCDGGLAVYSNATQASFDPDRTISADDRSTRDAVTPLTKTFQSGNRGLANVCAYAVAQDPGGLTQLYTGCVDSGIAFKDGGLGWRSWAGGDAFKVAVARASDGVRVRQEVFGGIGVGGRLLLGTHADAGGVSGAAFPLGDPGGSVISTSNYVIDASGNCLAGGFIASVVTQTTSLVPAASGASITVPVASTVGISNGSSIAFDNHPEQYYPVSNVTATSFDIRILYWTVPATTEVRLLQLCAFRNALDRSTVRISQLFTPNTDRDSVTAFARGAGMLACSTFDTVSGVTALWIVDEAATGGGAAAWTQIPLPAGVPEVAALALDAAGDSLILFAAPFADPVSGTVTPLYRVAAGGTTVEGESCAALPNPLLPDGATAAPFGRLAADPARANLLWATVADEVYRLELDTSSGARIWQWQQAGSGLPGTWITDLAFTNMADSAAPPKLILRAATDGRGVWELDTSDGAAQLATDLYLRRHLLDDGWTEDLRDALPHPLRPGEQVWHWECVDITIDRPVSVTASQQYFQTDPDASGSTYSDLTVPAGPILPATIRFSNSEIDMLNDFGHAVPAGNRVRVHVQLQNRATTPVDGVSVWPLWTRPAGLLPALNVNDDLSTFDFWGQFRPDGTIVPGLPANSRWKAVGNPIVLDGVSVTRPQIASWNWDAPSLGGHYCLAVFVHSLTSPIGETTNMSVDDIVLHNKQVGQKNLQVIDISGGMMRRLHGIVFYLNNPLAKSIATDLHVDATQLPTGVRVGVQLPPRLREPNAPTIRNARPAWGLRRLLDLLPRGIFGHPDFDSRIYRPVPGETLTLSGVRLGPHESIAARILIQANARTLKVARPRLTVRQVIDERLVGGSTIELRLPGKTTPTARAVPNSKVADADEYLHTRHR